MNQHFSVSRLMAVTTTATIVLLVVAALYAWVRLDDVANVAADAANRLEPQLGRVADVELNITRTSLLARHFMLVRTPADQQATLEEIGEKRRTIESAIEGFRQHQSNDGSSALFEELERRLATFWTIAGHNLELTGSGRKDQAFDHLVSTLVPARNRLLESIKALRTHQRSLLSEAVQRAAGDVRRTKGVLGGLLALVAMLMTSAALFTTSQIRRRVALVAQTAARIATGDLSRRVVAEGRDEFREMLAQLGEMQDSLEQMIGRVHRSSERIAGSSGGLERGNQNLSRRTVETASSLKETSASIEHLTETVRRSEDAAREANELVRAAADVATHGGEVMANVVSTMGDISERSRRIADIIGTIDDIAFQTNILALNAAVEAARAGPQGRGFSVVAAEVHALAQRSATAARETKSLIVSSVEGVESGSRLVSEAGETMTELVRSVRKVSDIIGSITAAAREQSRGIVQVKGSVERIDEMTRQNGALVEEAGAGASSLQEQVEALSAVVNAFTLSSGPPASGEPEPVEDPPFAAAA
jgi:methyl-accepting chemotaxis protein